MSQRGEPRVRRAAAARSASSGRDRARRPTSRREREREHGDGHLHAGDRAVAEPEIEPRPPVVEPSWLDLDEEWIDPVLLADPAIEPAHHRPAEPAPTLPADGPADPVQAVAQPAESAQALAQPAQAPAEVAARLRSRATLAEHVEFWVVLIGLWVLAGGMYLAVHLITG